MSAPLSLATATRRLPVLSFWQPFAWLVAQGHKPIENRGWVAPPGFLPIGGRFAIHAAKRRPKKDDDFPELVSEMRARGIRTPAIDDLRYGEIIGTARLSRYVSAAGEINPAHRFWYSGPVGWVLDDVRPLREGVKVKGRQGFFWLSPEMQARVIDLETPIIVGERHG